MNFRGFGQSVIVGLQEKQSHQRFAGYWQEVLSKSFINILKQQTHNHPQLFWENYHFLFFPR